MGTPTKPGTFWWRSAPDSPWQTVKVERGPRERLIFRAEVKFIGHPAYQEEFEVRAFEGEWGGHIPEPPAEPSGVGTIYETGEEVDTRWALVWIPVSAEQEVPQ